MQEIQRLAEEFERSRKLLQALGDETRQQLVLAMMQMGSAGVCASARSRKRRICPARRCRIIFAS